MNWNNETSLKGNFVEWAHQVKGPKAIFHEELISGNRARKTSETAPKAIT